MKKIFENKKLVIGLIIFAVVVIVFKINSIISIRNEKFENLKKLEPYIQTSDMNAIRAEHKSIVLDDGQILITGGTDGTGQQPGEHEEGLKSAEIFNPKTNKFTLISDMHLPHLYHSMFKLSNGNIAIADINGIEIFNPKTKTFKLLKTKPLSRKREFNSYTFNLIKKDRLLIVGGEIHEPYKNVIHINKIEIIDLKKDRLIKRIKFIRNAQGTCILKNGNVVLIGGTIIKNNLLVDSNEVYLFNTNNYKINRIGTLNFKTINPYIFELNNNNILIIGRKLLNHINPYYKYNQDGFNAINSPYMAIFNLKNRKLKLITTNQDLSKLDIKNVLNLDDSYLLFLLNKNNTNKFENAITELIKFDLNSFKFSDKTYITYYRNPNVIRFKNKLLISGGDINSQCYRECEPKDCIPNLICVSNGIKNSFILDLDKIGE